MNLSVPVGDDVALNVRYRSGTVPPAFLLVHGLDSNARMWDQVADHLAAAGHGVYAVNLRGHGESDAPDDGYDNATATADLVALGTALGLAGAVVAGHSWGAHIALRLAAEHPGLVAGLALVEGGWSEPAAVYGSWEVFVEVVKSALPLSGPALDGATLEDIRGYLRALHPDWSARAIEASLSCLQVHSDGSLSPPLSTSQRTAIMHSLWNDPPSRWFPAITVPVLLMPAVPIANSRWPERIRVLVELIRSSIDAAVAALPRATLREYLGSDHDLHVQHPDRVAGDLLWLAHTVQRPMALKDQRPEPT